MKKFNSLHVTATKFIGKKRLVWKKSQLYFKNYDFCEYVKFGVILLKIDIL